MAQETRVAPIEFSNTPTQVLLSIAEQKQQEAAKKQQLEFEKAKYLRSIQEDEMKRRYENAQTFNTAIQNQDWTKETRDLYLNNLLQNYANAKDVDSFEYRTNLGKQLGRIAQYNNVVKGIYSKADDYIKSLPDTAKQGLNAEVFKNRFIQSALTKDGRPKSFEELQKEYNDGLADEVFQANKQDLYDVEKGYNSIPDIIKGAAASTISVSEKDQKGRTVSGKSVTVQFKPEFEVYDEATGKVKLREDEFGYLDNTAYQRLTSVPSVDALATRKAMEFINNYNAVPKEAKLTLLGPNAMKAKTNLIDANKDGLPDMLTRDDLELVKKGFLTDYVKRQMPEYRKESESTTIVNNNSIGGNLGGGKGYEDAYQMLAQKVDSGDIKNIPANISNLIVDIANKQGKLGMLKGGKVQYTIKNLDIRRDQDGAIRVYDKLTGDPEPIYIDPKDFNISYNNLFGTKAQSAATNTPEEVYLGIGKDGKPMYGPKK